MEAGLWDCDVNSRFGRIVGNVSGYGLYLLHDEGLPLL